MMTNQWNLWAIIALCSLIVAACTPVVVDEPAAGMPTATPTQEPATEPVVPAALAPLVAQMRDDLAQRSGVSADAVRLVTLNSVTWADGSLGCPEPGMMYTMALVDGYQLLWEAAGSSWHYHTAGTDRYIPCARPTDPLSRESHAPQPETPAIQALAAVQGSPTDAALSPVAENTPAVPTPRPTRTPIPPAATATPQPRLEAPTPRQVTPVATLPLVQQVPSAMPLPVEQKVVPAAPVLVPTALEPLVAEMRADLALRSGLSADTVQLLFLRRVTWADGSIGCPQPGMMYTMALVDGYELVWLAGGKQWHYHTAGESRYLYCATPPGNDGPGGTTVYEE